MEDAGQRYPDQAPIHAYLGAVYHFELQQAQKAILHWRKAAVLAPNSERASLGLFQALWATDKIYEALEEMMIRLFDFP